LVLGVCLLLTGCERAGEAASAPEGGEGPVVARFEGGAVTQEELDREVQRLPPALRERFESGAGRREFIRSLVDKRLLAQEAARRGFTREEEVRRQVEELEERLSIQALLRSEERAAGKVPEEEARAFYNSNKARFAEPERVRVGRVHVAVPSGSGRDVWERAQKRARAFRQRLVAGESLARVAAEGDGAERSRGGELGLLARGEAGSAELEAAAFALTKQGGISEVVREEGGMSVLVLLERRAPRVPPFEEVREAVLGQMAPAQQRRVFDRLLARLRAEAGVRMEERQEPARGQGPRVAGQGTP
jgi:peptidyl-prolyl cis-trans isomerase C